MKKIEIEKTTMHLVTVFSNNNNGWICFYLVETIDKAHKFIRSRKYALDILYGESGWAFTVNPINAYKDSNEKVYLLAADCPMLIS